MSFAVNQFDESLGEFKTVEMGLSLGEVRQSILDRIREDLHWEEENGLDWRTRVLHHATDDHAADGAYRAADDMLYSMSETDIAGPWSFRTQGRVEIVFEDDE